MKKFAVVSSLLLSLISVSCAHTNIQKPEMTEGWSQSKSSFVKLKDGTSFRYLKLGKGQPLVMLHSLRTQLDLFYKLAPLLKDHFTLYLIDLPGHGYSDVDRQANYDANYFTEKTSDILRELNLGDIQVLGESIGASIALAMAKDPSLSIKKVFAVNPYDYGEKYGGGIRRSENGFWISTTKFAYLNIHWVLKDIFKGGVYKKKAVEPVFIDEMYKVGAKDHYGYMFKSLISNWRSWEDNKQNYAVNSQGENRIYLIYGEKDWSTKEEQQENKRSLSPAKFLSVKDAGHFISLDNPEEIKQFVLGNQE